MIDFTIDDTFCKFQIHEGMDLVMKFEIFDNNLGQYDILTNIEIEILLNMPNCFKNMFKENIDKIFPGYTERLQEITDIFSVYYNEEYNENYPCFIGDTSYYIIIGKYPPITYNIYENCKIIYSSLGESDFMKMVESHNVVKLRIMYLGNITSIEIDDYMKYYILYFDDMILTNYINFSENCWTGVCCDKFYNG